MKIESSNSPCRLDFERRVQVHWLDSSDPEPYRPQVFKRRSFSNVMVRLLVRDRESIQEAVRRFRKLVERSGIKKEMRRREFYEKPSETKRRSRLRAERRSKRMRLMGGS